jgi:hypothetical protein
MSTRPSHTTENALVCNRLFQETRWTNERRRLNSAVAAFTPARLRLLVTAVSQSCQPCLVSHMANIQFKNFRGSHFSLEGRGVSVANSLAKIGWSKFSLKAGNDHFDSKTIPVPRRAWRAIAQRAASLPALFPAHCSTRIMLAISTA